MTGRRIANPCDHDYADNLYVMWAGAVGTTEVYVWANSFDDAFELFVDYLDDKGMCGYFVDVTMDDLKESARELGIKWDAEWDEPGSDAYDDPEFERIVEHAEMDLTSIGHTTLECGQYMPSWEWGGQDVVDKDHYERLRRESERECEDEDD